MKKELFGFLFTTLLVLAGSFGILFGIYHFGLQKEMPTALYLLFPFFWIFFVVFHGMILKGARKRPQLFVSYYMGGIAIKLFAAMAIMLLYSYFNRETMVPFALTFVALYMILTGVEVFTTFRYLKELDRSKRQKDVPSTSKEEEKTHNG